jgi:hypothetical protein
MAFIPFADLSLVVTALGSGSLLAFGGSFGVSWPPAELSLAPVPEAERNGLAFAFAFPEDFAEACMVGAATEPFAEGAEGSALPEI